MGSPLLGLLLFVVCFGSVESDQNLIGYDCTNPNAETTALDLNGVAPCDVQKVSAKEETLYYQIIQSRLYRPTHIYICLIRVTRSIQRCGMHSHVSAVNAGFTQKLITVGSNACSEIHKSRSFRFNSYVFDDLSPNSTNVRNVLLAGSVDSSGTCAGEAYSDEFGSWKSVIVQGIVEITIEDYTGVIEIKENRVILPRSGISCPYNGGYCLDSQQGEVVWRYNDAKDCRNDDIDVLYEGPGTKAISSEGDTILIIRDAAYTYALRLLTQDYLCSVIVYKTDHGRVYASETPNSRYQFVKSGTIYSRNVDLVSYMGTKFLYIAHKIQMNIEHVVYGLLMKECETRKLTLENRLALASITPDHVGMLTEGPGYYGRVLGEVLYIIKCVPVSVQLRYSKTCYQEIPIAYNNMSQFLSPVTHLIVPLGREIPCDSILHPKFMLGGKWYIRNPNLMATPAPIMLNPNSEVIWKYDSLVDVTVGGLYSVDQIQSLQTEMMFPTVREAVSSGITRRISNSGGRDMDFTTLLSGDELDYVASSVAGKISWFFRVFGNYTSVFIGCYMCWKLTIYIIGVITNCFVLKKNQVSKFGYLSAMIDSVTSLLTTHRHLITRSKAVNRDEHIQLGKARDDKDEEQDDDAVPERDLIIPVPPPDNQPRPGPTAPVRRPEGILYPSYMYPAGGLGGGF